MPDVGRAPFPAFPNIFLDFAFTAGRKGRQRQKEANGAEIRGFFTNGFNFFMEFHL